MVQNRERIAITKIEMKNRFQDIKRTTIIKKMQKLLMCNNLKSYNRLHI